MNKDYEKYMMAIPIVPEVATKIMQINDDSVTFSTVDLTHLISLDPYLSASILKIANSALYSRRNEIRSLDTAVTLIGFKKIKTMVLLLAGASLFKKNTNSHFYQLFWSHSIISAFVCKDIAEMIETECNSDEYFTAALIHRIGEVPLYMSDKNKYLTMIDRIASTDKSLCNFERVIFNVDYCIIGGELLSYWEFPDELIKSAKYSCNSEYYLSDVMGAVIKLSDWITIQQGFGIQEHIETEQIDKILNLIGLSRSNYDFFTSEAYYEQIKNTSFFKECQSTLNVNFSNDELE